VGQCPTWWPPCRIQVTPSVQHRNVWLTPTTRVTCSKAAKTRNPLKLARVPQAREPISAVRGPKFTILWSHVEEILLFNKFFPIVNTFLLISWGLLIVRMSVGSCFRLQDQQQWTPSRQASLLFMGQAAGRRLECLAESSMTRWSSSTM